MPIATLSRRAFLRLALAPLAASAAASLAGCRIAGADGGEPALPLVEGDEEGYVFDNHQHEAVLPKAVIEAGSPVSLSILGDSTHDHTLKLSQADLADIRAGREVRVRSSNDWGHYHDVLFNSKQLA